MHNLYREQHPLVYVICHWINLLSMFFLILSGFYIHYPVFGSLMGVARGIHFFWMFVLCFNTIFRIVSSFFVKDAILLDTRETDYDYKNWFPQKINRHQLWPWIKYYLFLKKDTPISAKYGVLQKIAYGLCIPLITFAAITGFCMWEPTSQWAVFQWVTTLIGSVFSGGGSTANSLMDVRIVHYYIMWVIIIFTIAHVYLANIYNFAPSKIILFWEETEFNDH